eukprot:CAMPEP_0184711704 /NCGR_PEP_ID=MMETSP0314-20130426/2366_1 /TAXON_ID=38298 /ORGANISM="Rhodella maculata, Strain CCMP 736" /LENGTH=73 /DNA_ID=CAMNT_0027173941 /DNA_START=150 /DNA_END=371 /DNA_ORIENTATION=+
MTMNTSKIISPVPTSPVLRSALIPKTRTAVLRLATAEFVPTSSPRPMQLRGRLSRFERKSSLTPINESEEECL